MNNNLKDNRIPRNSSARQRSRESKRKRVRTRVRNDRYCERRREHKRESYVMSRNSYENRVQEYEGSIKSGPTHICVSCGQLFNKIGIKVCERQKAMLSIDQTLLSTCLNQVGYTEERLQFCITCHNSFFKYGLVPRLCLANGLVYPEIPEELIGLSRLEGLLVSQILVFMRISELRPTRQLQLTGNIVNIPIPLERSIDILPRSFDKSSIIQLVLKRALHHKSHYVKEYVRPYVVYKAAQYLVQQPLLREENIRLDPRWLSEHSEEREEFIVDNSDIVAFEQMEGQPKNPMIEDKWDETTDEDLINPALDETLLKDEIYFAPGEHSRPIAITSDPYLEEKAFPLIYCGQKFESAVKITYNDRVKSEIRRFDRRCCVPDKLFAMMRKKEIIGLDNSIGIYCKMISNSQMTVSQALDKDFVENLIRNDDAFQVLSTDRLSPVYWSRKKRELMAMIRTLGIPTFFLTLSAAETRWPELLVLLAKVLKKKDITEEEAMGLSFAEKCQLIRDDPVTCSRYFDRRIRELFKLLKCENGPFGHYRLVDLYIRIEFQHRGSPHVHSLLWLEGSPKYDLNLEASRVACEEFIEQFITTSTKGLSIELYGRQIHKHSSSCKRMRGDSFVCRFGIPHYPMPKSLILEPLKEDDLTYNEIEMFPGLLDRVQRELSSIAAKLNDKKGKSIIPTFEQFLRSVGCSYESYERLIRSTLIRAKVFLKRSLNEIRTNGFNREILSRHRANMDLQFVLDPYATVHYILDYINKSNRGMSKLMKDVVQQTKEGYQNHRQKLYKISSKFINCSEVSAQEAVYILLSMPLSISSRSSIFVNTGEKADRVRRLRSEKELRDMDPDCADTMMDGLLEYYVNRPDSLNHICLAEFASIYDYSKRRNIKRVNEANEEHIELFNDESTGKYIPLMSNKGFVKLRKVPKVIRYRKYNPAKDMQNFMREKVMLYVPWKDEDLELINVDIQAKYETSRDLIKSLEEHFVHNNKYDYEDIEKNLENENKIEYEHSQDNLNEDNEFQVLDQVRNDLNFEAEYLDVSTHKAVVGTFSSPRMIEDNHYYHLIRRLNAEQREFVIGVINHVKHSTDAFYYFLTGGAGTGKSLTISAVYQILIRWFAKQPDLKNIDNPTVLLTGPTGKSAFNIGGMTLHSALGLSVSQSQRSQKRMNDELKSKMRNKLWNLKVLIIDEVSMVGATTLHKVDEKLREIFERDIPFAGISILYVGDFNQLKPVCDRYVFENSNASDYAVLAGRLLWEPVKYYRLTECMRQRGDLLFAQALNRLAEGKQLDEDKCLFNSRLFDEMSSDLPENAIRLFPRNAQVERYNDRILRRDNGNTMYFADAKDECQNKSAKIREKALAIVGKLTVQETSGLPKRLDLKFGVRYMITVNIDTEDGLVNGSSGVLRHIDLVEVNGVPIIQRVWIDFENPLIGQKSRSMGNKLVINGCELTLLNRTVRDVPTKSGSIFVFVTRTQFPLVVAEALTIHKSQGQTYDTVVVSVSSKLDLQLMYTAFSRSKTANGLYLTGKQIRYPLERLPTHRVSMELERLESSCSLNFGLPFVARLEKPNGSLVTFFQNLPYLAKYCGYLDSDPDIKGSDLLFFVETHSTNVQINGFNLIGENCPNRSNGSMGISVYCKPHINAIVDDQGNYGDSTAHLEYIRVTVTPDIVVYVVYASPRFSKMNTIGILENFAIEVLGNSTSVFIYGDLNIQSCSDNGSKLINMMHCHGLELMVKFGSPSTDNGNQIDYLFSSDRTLLAAYHESLISDHKPIISLIQKN